MIGRFTTSIMYFFLRSGWQVQFLEPDLKTPSKEIQICRSGSECWPGGAKLGGRQRRGRSSSTLWTSGGAASTLS